MLNSVPKPKSKCRQCNKVLTKDSLKKYCNFDCRRKFLRNKDKIVVQNPSGRFVKVGLKQTKQRAWTAFSKYIRTRDSIKTTGTKEFCICITCNHRVPFWCNDGNFIQAGHAIASRTNSILFDEELVNGQCQQCNCFKHGNYHLYEQILVKQHGQEWWDNKMALKHISLKFSILDYLEIEKQYLTKLEAYGSV